MNCEEDFFGIVCGGVGGWRDAWVGWVWGEAIAIPANT